MKGVNKLTKGMQHFVAIMSVKIASYCVPTMLVKFASCCVHNVSEGCFYWSEKKREKNDASFPTVTIGGNWISWLRIQQDFTANIPNATSDLFWIWR